MPHIHILLASYNGARFLRAQLDSIAAQQHRDWSLLVSDDNSTDGTQNLVADFGRDRPDGQIRLLDGPRQGATANFLSLIKRATDNAWLALSDQDDVWLPEKLSRATDKLAAVSGPALYCARTVICDEALEDRHLSRLFVRPHGFRNALVQACTAGNTIVLNAAAADIAKAGVSAAQSAGVISHDWWLYQLISGAGGAVIWDRQPALLYRQHGDNEMGQNDTTAAKLKRIAMLMGGEYRNWLGANIRALRGAQELLTTENLAILDAFETALATSGPMAALYLRRMGVYRQDRPGTAALYLAALAGRLRQPGGGNPSR